MFRKWHWIALWLCVSSLFAAEQQPWKDKKAAEWTDEDAKLVVTQSPWAKSVTPSDTRNTRSSSGPSMGRGGGRRGGGGGMGGGMGRGGVRIGGLGIPGAGGGRNGGGGYPSGNGGGNYPGGAGPDSRTQNQDPPLKLTLRWESALPIREAELKTRDVNAPTVDEKSYEIAVYGVPQRMVGGAAKSLLADMKKHAVLKRDGKKDIKASSVKVIDREDGPVVVYFFPRSKEISKSDGRVEFDAQINRLTFTEAFFTEDMLYNNKLEL